MIIDRRQFVWSSTSLALASCFCHAIGVPTNGCSDAGKWIGDGKPSPLVNYNCATLVGLGDEPPAFLDQFGQLSGRTAQVLLDIGYPVKPYEDLRSRPDGDWAQWLESGYLPIVRSKVNAGDRSVDWTAFSSGCRGIKAEHVVLNDASVPLRLRLAFPYEYSVSVQGNMIVSNDHVCAIIPDAKIVGTTSARYNLLSPESWSNECPHWSPYVPVKDRPGLAKAFNSSRGIYLYRSIDYLIPVTQSAPFYVYVGVISDDKLEPGDLILRFTVNDLSQSIDFAVLGAGNPGILQFVTSPEQGNIKVSAECDVSAGNNYRDCFINGIWLFDHAVDPRELQTGNLDSAALVHIDCGREVLTDAAATVDLELEGNTCGQHLLFPFDLQVHDAPRVAGITVADAEDEVSQKWNAFIDKGARLSVGVPHLDNLYRASLLNLLLMRTKYPGAGADGQDVYVVKPGASTYDDFWMRDAAYIANALGIAGHTDETEKSLRIFWQRGLKGIFASWGQQPSGCWQSPLNEWDSTGQALWALVHHFQLTRDREWLRTAYGSIRSGAMWIHSACEQMKVTREHGDRPIYYGLLPAGVGEGIGNGINYYHDFWAVLGLRQAIVAAEALGETADARLFANTYDELRASLLTSVRWAFQHTGKGKYIPAMPFKAGENVWGSLSALYPCGLLDPHDAMMTATLATLQGQIQEDIYTYTAGYLWTYITADLAMCHLLRNETDQFCRLFDGFVAHSSPTNAWIEQIMTESRRGTGDMPHGWAAANYVILYRNSFVYENNDTLELCKGVRSAWLPDGAVLLASEAPTRFGKVHFELRRNGSRLVASYQLAGTIHPAPGNVVLYLPALEGVSEISVNAKRFVLTPGQNLIAISA